MHASRVCVCGPPRHMSVCGGCCVGGGLTDTLAVCPAHASPPPSPLPPLLLLAPVMLLLLLPPLPPRLPRPPSVFLTALPCVCVCVCVCEFVWCKGRSSFFACKACCMRASSSLQLRICSCCTALVGASWGSFAGVHSEVLRAFVRWGIWFCCVVCDCMCVK
jgi:hypothetical protein